MGNNPNIRYKATLGIGALLTTPLNIIIAQKAKHTIMTLFIYTFRVKAQLKTIKKYINPIINKVYNVVETPIKYWTKPPNRKTIV
tara:strand:+ start:6724 stop:6978 length:255 start_codon:yes stop_codon:yes gene_type:complete